MGNTPLWIACLDELDLPHLMATDASVIGRMIYACLMCNIGLDERHLRVNSQRVLVACLDNTLRLPNVTPLSTMTTVAQKTQELVLRHSGTNPDTLSDNPWLYQAFVENYLLGEVKLRGPARTDWPTTYKLLEDLENSVTVNLPTEALSTTDTAGADAPTRRLSALELAFFRQQNELEESGAAMLRNDIPGILAHLRENNPESLSPLGSFNDKVVKENAAHVGLKLVGSKVSEKNPAPEVPDLASVHSSSDGSKPPSVSEVALTAQGAPVAPYNGAPTKKEPSGPFSSKYSDAERKSARDKYIKMTPSQLHDAVRSVEDDEFRKYFHKNKDKVQSTGAGSPAVDLKAWKSDSKGTDPPILRDSWSPKWWFLMFRCRTLTRGYSKANLALDKEQDPDFDESSVPSMAVFKALCAEHTKKKAATAKERARNKRKSDGGDPPDDDATNASAKLSVEEEAEKTVAREVEEAKRSKALKAALAKRRASYNASVQDGVTLDVDTGHVTGGAT